jgi:protein involved in polysaccharide export with SLBB domain
MYRILKVLAIGLASYASPGFAQTIPAPADGGAIAAGADARIRPGDQVMLQIWREEDLSGEFSVDENGEVVLPRLGVVRASDHTVGELRRALRDSFAEYVRTPSIEVTVLRRVGVHGEVRNPDLYMIDLTLTLREVIAKAGGVTPEGNPSSIMIVRGDERIVLGRDEYARFTTAQLRSGDQVVVGRRNWLSLNPLAAVSTATVVLSVILSVLR